MTRSNRIMTFMGMLGFVNGMNEWEDILISDKTKKVMKDFENNILDLLIAYRLTQEESYAMDKKVTNIRFGSFDKVEMTKKLRNKQIVVTQDTMDTITEHAINFRCTNCNRNISACGLRKAFKKAGVACFDKVGKCEYMVKGGK